MAALSILHQGLGESRALNVWVVYFEGEFPWRASDACQHRAPIAVLSLLA